MNYWITRYLIRYTYQGELESIVLAQELASDYVVLDDLLARRKAKRLGVKVIGTIGILLLLEKRGALNAKQTWEKIMQLVEQHNMYLSPHMLEQLKEQLL
jgi:predicted nucleic acid-binding protein